VTIPISSDMSPVAPCCEEGGTTRSGSRSDSPAAKKKAELTRALPGRSVRSTGRRRPRSSAGLPRRRGEEGGPRPEGGEGRTGPMRLHAGGRGQQVVGLKLRGGVLRRGVGERILGVHLLQKPARSTSPPALVTKPGGHFKGAESSIVWGDQPGHGLSPSRGAGVALRDCHGSTVWEGKTVRRDCHDRKALPGRPCPAARGRRNGKRHPGPGGHPRRAYSSLPGPAPT
jgi:hypothetical protein